MILILVNLIQQFLQFGTNRFLRLQQHNKTVWFQHSLGLILRPSLTISIIILFLIVYISQITIGHNSIYYVPISDTRSSFRLSISTSAHSMNTFILDFFLSLLLFYFSTTKHTITVFFYVACSVSVYLSYRSHLKVRVCLTCWCCETGL